MDCNFVPNQERCTAITPPRVAHGCFNTIAKKQQAKTHTVGGRWLRRTITQYRCRCCWTRPKSVLIQIFEHHITPTISHIISTSRLNPVPMIQTTLPLQHKAPLTRSGCSERGKKDASRWGMVSNVGFVHRGRSQRCLTGVEFGHNTQARATGIDATKVYEGATCLTSVGTRPDEPNQRMVRTANCSNCWCLCCGGKIQPRLISPASPREATSARPPIFQRPRSSCVVWHLHLEQIVPCITLSF